MGGGPEGSIGAAWSWALGVVACAAVVRCWRMAAPGAKSFTSRCGRWRPKSFSAALAALLILGAVAVANAYPWPIGSVRRYAQANHIALPDGGLFIAHGIAIPVLIAIGVGIVMTFLATRTRFGRYVYAIGGNPEAAELAGIDTRWVIVKVFMLMGLLPPSAARYRSRGSMRRPIPKARSPNFWSSPQP